jgi:hypothetical protein
VFIEQYKKFVPEDNVKVTGPTFGRTGPYSSADSSLAICRGNSKQPAADAWQKLHPAVSSRGAQLGTELQGCMPQQHAVLHLYMSTQQTDHGDHHRAAETSNDVSRFNKSVQLPMSNVPSEHACRLLCWLLRVLPAKLSSCPLLMWTPAFGQRYGRETGGLLSLSASYTRHAQQEESETTARQGGSESVAVKCQDKLLLEKQLPAQQRIGPRDWVANTNSSTGAGYPRHLVLCPCPAFPACMQYTPVTKTPVMPCPCICRT